MKYYRGASMSRKLVAYFSATGNTAKIANMLADAVDADVFEIEPVVPYTLEDLNWRNPKSRSSIEMKNHNSRPAIARIRDNMDIYDVVYIGFPIWWYTAPTIVNTFLESHNLAGKRIIPFATSGGSGMDQVYANLAPSCFNVVLTEGCVFKTDISLAELAEWGNKS